MTTPAPDVVVSTWNVDTADTSPKVAIRRTAIQALSLSANYQYDGTESDGAPINMRTVYNVIATTGCGISAVVASFDAQGDAADYIGSDPEGYLEVRA